PEVLFIDLDRAGTREIRGHHVLDFDIDVMAHRTQSVTYVLGNARVDLELLALIVDARPARRVLRPVAVVDGVRDRLPDGAHALASPRSAADEERFAAAQDDRRRACPQDALAGRDRVGAPRPRVEPVRP